MKYVHKQDKNRVVTVKEVKKDTVIKSAEYGEILVTAGNYILKSEDGNTGSEVGITPGDLELWYKPVK